MSKHKEKIQQEIELLKSSCQNNPHDVELIQQLLQLQKKKTLLIRKRGLQSDIDQQIEEFINKKNTTN